MFKFGDGITHWNNLIYSNQISSEDNNNTSLTAELERLHYYGDNTIIPSDESYFTVNETGETITGLTDTGKTQTELVIPYKIDGVEITTLNSGSGFTSILDGVTDKITKVILPNSIVTIADYAFVYCSSLTSINIPNSVTSIRDYAFSECTSLTSINIPNSVTSIGIGAFNRCSSLTSVNIPNSVTSIGGNAFSKCTSLTSINIPNSVTSIEHNAFEYCPLKSINIPNSVTSIGYFAFMNCTSLTSINIPNSVTSIADYAFVYCSSLTSINIPNSVTSIGMGAFNGCSSLTSVNIPNSVTSIGETAFDSISSDAVFYVEQGSYAETYAKENNIQFVYTIIDKDDYLANIQTLTIGKSYRTGQVAFIRDLSAASLYRTFEIRVCQKDHTVTNELCAAWSNGEEIFTDYWNGSQGILIESAVSDAQGDIIHETYETKDDATNKQIEADIYTDRQIDSLRSDVSNNYSRIPEVVFDISETYTMDLSTSDNHIIYANNAAGFLNPLSTLNLKFSTGSYSYTYTSEIIFTSGETATQIVYPNTGIINWIGTDCALSDGKSVFIPSPNTRYDVIISFDGKQLVGYVCGYTPATVNNG